MPNRLKALLITLWIFIFFWWVITVAILFPETSLCIIWGIVFICMFLWIYFSILEDLEGTNPDVQQ